MKGLTKRLVERALAAELTNHLGYVPHARHQAQNGNVRNGTGAKTVETDQGPMELAVPRDRAGTFEPTVVKKRQRRASASRGDNRWGGGSLVSTG